MVFPLIPLLLGSAFAQSGASSLYSGYKQRQMSRYYQSGYERQLQDWNKNVGQQGREIKYPELSYEGQIKQQTTNQAISYVNSAQSLVNMASGAYSVGSSAYNARNPYRPSTSQDLGNLYG